MNTYDNNLRKARELGYEYAACLVCSNRSHRENEICKKCISQTGSVEELEDSVKKDWIHS